MLQTIARTILWILAVFCLIVFFSFNLTWEQGHNLRIAVGYTPSPWLYFRSDNTGAAFNMAFSSWSWLFGLAGLLFIGGARKMGT